MAKVLPRNATRAAKMDTIAKRFVSAIRIAKSLSLEGSVPRKVNALQVGHSDWRVVGLFIDLFLPKMVILNLRSV